MQMDPLVDALTKIRAYENRRRKRSDNITPASTVIHDVLATLQKSQYIGRLKKLKMVRVEEFKYNYLEE